MEIDNIRERNIGYVVEEVKENNGLFTRNELMNNLRKKYNLTLRDGFNVVNDCESKGLIRKLDNGLYEHVHHFEGEKDIR
ncbi:MAG: hypothetical protein ABIB79_04030 [archaeon]